MVSAFCSVNGLSLDQVRTGEKSNEIMVIPALIGALDLSGCIVTIDVMGCLKEYPAKRYCYEEKKARDGVIEYLWTF